MHFIITGGAGFIGSYLTEKLLSEGHKVTVVDNLITGNLNNLHDDQHNLKIITKNILDCHPLDFNYPIDGIAHLAATPSVSESWEKLMETHDNNLSTTIAVIQLCQKLNIPRLVFASSAAVYGTKITLPISENQPLQPISPYGLQKLFSEQYTSLLAQKIGFSFVSLRLFNVFGYRQLPTSPYSGVISILLAAMQENKPIVIYGDGTQTRDFIYVKDVAIAFSKALTIPLTPGSFLPCNIGTGKATSLLDIINILKGYFPHWQSEINFAPFRSGDIRHSQADISTSSSILKFTPEFSIQSGLHLFIESLGCI